MELSKAIASIAVVLGVILAAGYANGEASEGATLQVQSRQQKIEEREAQRRLAVEEQQKRKDEFERACHKPLRTDAEFESCRAAYRRLETGKI